MCQMTSLTESTENRNKKINIKLPHDAIHPCSHICQKPVPRRELGLSQPLQLARHSGGTSISCSDPEYKETHPPSFLDPPLPHGQNAFGCQQHRCSFCPRPNREKTSHHASTP